MGSRRQQPPPYQLVGLGNAVTFPSGIWGKGFFTILITWDDLQYCYYNCALSCTHWVQDPVPLPAYATEIPPAISKNPIDRSPVLRRQSC